MHSHHSHKTTTCLHEDGHSHGKFTSHSASNNIALALLLNLSFAFIELFGGLWTSSTAIQADAFHDFGDSMALGLALLLQVFSRVKPTKNFTYGFKRLSLVSAFSTSLLLFGGSLYIITEAGQRLKDPITPHLQGMFWLAILGVVVNGIAAWRMSFGSTQNEKAISWHMIEDLLGWLAVLVSSIVMRFIEAPWLDPLLAIVIAIIILFGALRNLWSSFRLFLQSVPQGLSEIEIKDAVKDVNGIIEIQSIQLWSLDGSHHICSAKVVLSDKKSFEDWQQIRVQVHTALTSMGHGEIDLTLEPV